MITFDPFAGLERRLAQRLHAKQDALIERQGAVFIVGNAEFITTSEVLAVEGAHAYAYAQQEWFRQSRALRNEPAYYLPEIYRVPLNTAVRRLGDFVLYSGHTRSWGRSDEGAHQSTAAFTALDNQRQLFAADRSDDVDRQQPTEFPHDADVAGWVWTSRNEGSFWRGHRFAVYTDEARAIAATDPHEPLYGIYPGGRTRTGVFEGRNVIRGYFDDTGRWGYRTGHGTADPRHPSHTTTS